MKTLIGLLAVFVLGGCFILKDTVGPKGGNETPELALGMDEGTVFFADFNGHAVNLATGDSARIMTGNYVGTPFGSGLVVGDPVYGKPIARFANKPDLSLTTGTMEALVYAATRPSGFAHIIDKSWLYGLTSYGGALAVDFGDEWWYSSDTLPLHRWTYLAATFDGTMLRLYRDGNPTDSTRYRGMAGNSEYDLGIGNAADDGFDIPFYGIIDEVRISRQARTPDAIKAAWEAIKTRLQ
jgi:hypothetical protein